MDRGAWQATVQGVRKELDTTERIHFHFHVQIPSFPVQKSKAPSMACEDIYRENLNKEGRKQQTP